MLADIFVFPHIAMWVMRQIWDLNISRTIRPVV
jgi:hypothetical protein